MKKKVKQSMVALTLGVSLCGFALPASASTYTIKENDTFWNLSQARGVSLDAMIKANNGANPLNLQPGQTIVIPDSTYQVKDNETFWTIARDLKLSVDDLQAANKQVNSKNVYAGLILNLPESSLKSQSTKAPQILTETTSANSVKTPSGESVNYSKVVNATATAYSSAAEENGQWGAVDYFGNPLELGTVAVDPNVIPMGSKLLITGYTNDGLPVDGLIAYAKDQGGAIKGNRIDIFLPGSREKVSDFGIQNVKVYVLK